MSAGTVGVQLYGEDGLAHRPSCHITAGLVWRTPALEARMRHDLIDRRQGPQRYSVMREQSPRPSRHRRGDDLLWLPNDDERPPV